MYFKRFLPRWTQLATLGKSSVSKSAYLWLLIVPLAATILGKLSPDVTIELFNRRWELVLRLPFSWKALFWASLCASIGNLLFGLYCPRIIAQYRDFADFKQANGASHALRTAVAEAYFEFRRDGKLCAAIVADFLFNHLTYGDPETSRLRDATRASDQSKVAEVVETHFFLTTEFASGREMEAFEFAREFTETRRPAARAAITIFYAIAFLFVAYIIAQNAVTVLRFSMR